MARARQVEPEWLDTLPGADPQALRSRRDLRLLNAWMFQAAIMGRLVAWVMNGHVPRIVIDLGAGDGMFLLGLARRMGPHWGSVQATLVDRRDVVSAETRAAFAALRWQVDVVTADVFDFTAQAAPGSADLVTANLFLHHFARDELARLLGDAARMAAGFAACEPRRSALALAASKAVWLLGCNRVTRHDAPVSVRAGFVGSEISALWPRGKDWQTREFPAGLFTHCFAARHGG